MPIIQPQWCLDPVKQVNLDLQHIQDEGNNNNSGMGHTTLVYSKKGPNSPSIINSSLPNIENSPNSIGDLKSDYKKEIIQTSWNVNGDPYPLES